MVEGRGSDYDEKTLEAAAIKKFGKEGLFLPLFVFFSLDIDSYLYRV